MVSLKRGRYLPFENIAGDDVELHKTVLSKNQRTVLCNSLPSQVIVFQKTLHRKVWHGPRLAGQTFRAEQQFCAGKIEGVFSGTQLPEQLVIHSW